MNSRETNSRSNYFAPLQCHPDSGEEFECDEVVVPQTSNKKLKIPSICVLQKTSGNVHNLLGEVKVTNYSIKKMSIGIKINCENIDSYNQVCAVLKSKNWQFFTHDLPSARSFKVILYGLDEISTDTLKNELVQLGLKCQNIKMIKKKYEKFTDVFYLIFLESGSIRLNDLKKNVRSIFKTQVKWDFARRQINKVTQCYNCQMYGHGEKNCHIKTHCGICSENHETSACDSNNIKCANCNGTHKSSDPACESRQNFFKIRERLSARNKPYSQPVRRVQQTFIPNNLDFPALQSHHKGPVINETINCSRISNVWANNNNNIGAKSTSERFSMEEINALTAEMITLLGNCKTKAEQFNTIAQLAIKYLYQSK